MNSTVRGYFMHVIYQQADSQKAKVHPDVPRDPVETRRRRVRRGPCWPFLLLESSAQCLVQMRCLKRLEHCWTATNCKTEGQGQEIIRCVYRERGIEMKSKNTVLSGMKLGGRFCN